ncbi:hypothetical protein SK128_002399 [Halocaridina rubra]|uniref:Uncharacterized protein n=1 Tax=Halocaridina rubra TaxID=373956 RepID=A0AAN8WV26_HALRR
MTVHCKKSCGHCSDVAAITETSISNNTINDSTTTSPQLETTMENNYDDIENKLMNSSSKGFTTSRSKEINIVKENHTNNELFMPNMNKYRGRRLQDKPNKDRFNQYRDNNVVLPTIAEIPNDYGYESYNRKKLHDIYKKENNFKDYLHPEKVKNNLRKSLKNRTLGVNDRRVGSRKQGKKENLLVTKQQISQMHHPKNRTLVNSKELSQETPLPIDIRSRKMNFIEQENAITNITSKKRVRKYPKKKKPINTDINNVGKLNRFIGKPYNKDFKNTSKSRRRHSLLVDIPVNKRKGKSRKTRNKNGFKRVSKGTKNRKAKRKFVKIGRQSVINVTSPVLALPSVAEKNVMLNPNKTELSPKRQYHQFKNNTGEYQRFHLIEMNKHSDLHKNASSYKCSSGENCSSQNSNNSTLSDYRGGQFVGNDTEDYKIKPITGNDTNRSHEIEKGNRAIYLMKNRFIRNSTKLTKRNEQNKRKKKKRMNKGKTNKNLIKLRQENESSNGSDYMVNIMKSKHFQPTIRKSAKHQERGQNAHHPQGRRKSRAIFTALYSPRHSSRPGPLLK